ncbi:MAG TPA: hypothetical protein VMK31_08100 [Sphingomicrobium sp.]|nr:hypothetical protein [Sphingomicrobium sp.]
MAVLPRLLTLLAMLAMPFAMAPAPAASAITHHPVEAVPVEHCADGQPKDESVGDVGHHCTMPCSAALAALDDMRVALEPVVPGISDPVFAGSLAGILLEIATPPPRLALFSGKTSTIL